MSAAPAAHALVQGVLVKRDRTPTAVVAGPTLREALAGLPLRRLHARHRLLHDLHTEPFMGNLWRGQLGAWWHAHAPRACAALMGDGDGARHWALCAPWSDGEWVPAGAVLETRVTLIGHALEHEQAVVDALEEVGRQGLGARGAAGHRSKARLLEVNVEALPGTDTTTPSALDVLEHAVAVHGPRPSQDAAADPAASLHVVLHRPLRFKVDGEVFVGLPSMEQLLRRTLGRLVQLLPPPPGRRAEGADAADSEADGDRARLFDRDEHAAWIVAARRCMCVEHQLQAWHWRRRSRRSGQDMPVEGVTGRLHYVGPQRTLMPWLHLADWMQIGTKTTFGFGVIEAFGSD